MAEAVFTQERAQAVLESAGHPSADLLSFGENAVFAAGRLVIKVGRGADLLDRARREVRTADWLAKHDVPAVRSAESEVRLVDGHPVTYWQRLPESLRPAEPADVAPLLRLVHALPEPDFGLPPRDLLGGVERWLRLAGDAIDPAEAAFLRARRDRLAAAVTELVPHLPRGPIHGDALPRNVHIGPDGPVLVDLETFSSDLREHDLVVQTLSRDRYGVPPAAYSAFTRAYGWDVADWAGCEVLRGARETAGCAWVAQHAAANPAARSEFRRRVASLRSGDSTVRWYSF
ncbi:aminoglycoside phosphotransferase family protein [Actinacidiphila bryophytorum]|uniref:Phosphotransferase enzyme family protein n=1 Tax=Actinacidiphila bryophytorum TaxID=1436133 RepID=A0A9W4MK33_9ACTN|nr:aminoglycoside phosphotransferase family protein [Actinacidiphila bryophytorum]MBM9436682.1 aminoglycoside phosphotransferase family protein [Actinacidiphila bryophytorum]MBN6542865.1 aminoglycoside phosphotransferase family protein [Actinacidiphila bryophytorum]CAG7653975.1 Phosphotransferase enzyme family protein [Actinacidiphila bryophytorum]